MIPVMPNVALVHPRRRLATAVAAAVSPFTGTSQVQDWLGEWWEYDLTLTIRTPAQARRVSVFFDQLGGARGRFLMRDCTQRRIGTVGEPVVAGGSGNTLLTAGWALAEDRRNLLDRSEQMNTAFWTRFNVTVTDADLPTPDGRNAAQLVTETSANAIHSVSRTHPGLPVGTVVTWSRILRAAGRDAELALLGAFGTDIRCRFNLTSGAVTLVQGAPQARGAVDLGGGWWRCWIRAVVTSETPFDLPLRLVNGTSVTYAGNSSSGVQAAGAQVELGPLTAYQQVPGPVLQVGDLIQLGSGAETRMHRVTADVFPALDGTAALPVVPKLRGAPQIGSPIEVHAPHVLLRATDAVPTDMPPGAYASITFTAREGI